MSVLSLMNDFMAALKNAEERGQWVEADIGTTKFFITPNAKEISILEEMRSLPSLSNNIDIEQPEITGYDINPAYQQLSDIFLALGFVAQKYHVAVFDYGDSKMAVTTNQDIVIAVQSIAKLG